MLRDLLAAFSEDEALTRASKEFHEMLGLARDMAVSASLLYWNDTAVPESDALAREDARMNELQQSIRRSVILHLSASDATDVPYCLLLMSLVKDVERIGDYAKNLVSVPMLVGQGLVALPKDSLTAELREFARAVDDLAKVAPSVYDSSNRERAIELLSAGKARSKACDPLLRRVAAGNYDAATSTRLTLTIRFYKRIQGHFLNLLSSLIMPLDRVDCYDAASA